MRSSRNELTDSGRGTVRLLLLLVLIAMPATGGLLSLLEVIRDGDPGVSGLAAPIALAAAPDGHQLYAVSQEQALTVFGFAADTPDAPLVPRQTLRNGVGGVAGLEGPTAIATSAGGDNLYVTSRNSGPDSIAVFRRVGAGSDADYIEFRNLVVDGDLGVFGLAGAAAAAVSPDDRHLLVVGSDDASVVMFRRDATPDRLGLVDAVMGLTRLAGASSVTLSADGHNAYVTARDANAVTILERNATADRFALYGSHFGLPGLIGAADVAVDPAGDRVYVAGSGDGAIAVFARNPAFGTLTYLGALQEGVNGVHGLAGVSSLSLSSDGRILIALGHDADAVAVFARAVDALGLLQVQLLDDRDPIAGDLGAPVAIAVDPGRPRAYVASLLDDAVNDFHLASLVFADGLNLGTTGAWSAQAP